MRFFPRASSFLTRVSMACLLGAAILFSPCVFGAKKKLEKKKAEKPAAVKKAEEEKDKDIPKAMPVTDADLPKPPEKPFEKVIEREKAAAKSGEKIVERPLADDAEYQAGLRALADGWPQVAAVKFEKLMGNRAFNRADTARLTEHLVDALLRSRQWKKALVAITLFDVPDSPFWEGQALLMDGNYHDAENALKEYLRGKNPRYAPLAHLTLAKAIIAQGRENTGRKELREVAEDTKSEYALLASQWVSESELLVGREEAVLKRWDPGTEKMEPKTGYLVSCALMARNGPGDLSRAEHILQHLVGKESEKFTSLREHDAVASRLAEVYELQGRHRLAEKFLREYIEESAFSNFYDQLFAQLERVRSVEDDDTLDSYLRWASTPSMLERRTYAWFYIAQWLIHSGKAELALGYLEGLHALVPAHPRDSETMRLMMSIYGSLHADERVLELAGDWRQRHGSGGKDVVDFLTAIIRFSRGEYADAMALFQRSAAAAADGVQRRRALFNLGVAAMMGDSQAGYERAVSALGPASDADAESAKVQPDDASAANLQLEHALHLAKDHDTGAEDALRDFIKGHPNHARNAEAQIALAEFCLLDVPPRAKAAQAALDAAASVVQADDAATRERLDYTRVWAAEAADDLPLVAALGQDFAQHWPVSARVDEMRMKSAQAYFRQGDFLRARTQFQQLEEDHPDSPYAETALFFAAKSSMSLISTPDLNKALDLFGEVVRRAGPLAVEARWQQVAIKRQQNKLSEAIAALDAMIATKPPPEGESLAAMLLEKGELLVLQSRESPRSLDDAAEVFRSAVAVPGIPRQWRWRGQVLLAQTQERLGKSNESLETSHDLIESAIAAGSGTKPLTPQEMTWFYRAGFMATDILEAQKEWEAAARLCERIAATNGPRSVEAKDRATRIREVHFLWDK
jgi:TolA-binding protein